MGSCQTQSYPLLLATVSVHHAAAHCSPLSLWLYKPLCPPLPVPFIVKHLQDEDNAPLEGRFSDCRIWFDLEGSDHAPVWADLQLPGGLPQGARPPALDVRNRQSTGGEASA